MNRGIQGYDLEVTPMKDCNKCEYNGDRRCPAELRKLPVDYASGCTMYVPPKRMKAPMLHHLVYGGKVGQLAEVLTAFNMRLVDTTHYPKFKLQWEGK